MIEKKALEHWGKDYSRWLNREKLEENRIPNTVRILIGDEIIVCNGLILASWSRVLKNVIIQSDEVRLDEYLGHTEEFYDCLELLYGGKVSLSFENVEGILQFSCMFEINAMFEMCKKWLLAKMSPEKMYTIFSLLDSYKDWNQDLDNVNLETFKTYFDFPEYIHNNLAAVTTEVQKKDIRYTKNFIHLLLTQSCSIQLILLIDWIQSEADVESILHFMRFQFEECEARRISYYDKLLCEKLYPCTRSAIQSLQRSATRYATLNLIKRMKFFTVTDKTKSMIQELEGNLLKHLQDQAEMLSMTRTPFLENKVWTKLTESQIMSQHHGDFGLKNFEFAEVAVEWLKDDHRRLQASKTIYIQKLHRNLKTSSEFEDFFTRFRDKWSIKEYSLSRDYLKTLYSSLTLNTMSPDETFILPSWDMPFEMESHCFKMSKSQVNDLKKGDCIVLDYAAHKQCDAGLSFFTSYNCRFIERAQLNKVGKDKISFSKPTLFFSFKLTDSQPCYEILSSGIESNGSSSTDVIHSPRHIYISYKENLCRKLFSFVTHTRSELVQFLEDLMSKKIEFSLNCMTVNLDYNSDKAKLAEKEEMRSRINRITDGLYYDSSDSDNSDNSDKSSI